MKGLIENELECNKCALLYSIIRKLVFQFSESENITLPIYKEDKLFLDLITGKKVTKEVWVLKLSNGDILLWKVENLHKKGGLDFNVDFSEYIGFSFTSYGEDFINLESKGEKYRININSYVNKIWNLFEEQ